MKKQKEDIDKRIQELEQQAADVKNKYLRALADYQNLEKRTHEDMVRIRMQAGEDIIRKLLHVVDGLEKADVHLKDPGLGLVLKEFYAVLEESGVQKVDVLGQIFDPHRMECIEVVEGENEKVVEVVEEGYSLNNHIIRIAKVKVGKSLRTK